MKKMKIQGRTALVLAALIRVSSLGTAFAGILGGQGLQARMAQGRQIWPTKADQVVALEEDETAEESGELEISEESSALEAVAEAPAQQNGASSQKPKEINGYQVIPIPMTYEEIMKAYNTVREEYCVLQQYDAQFVDKPSLNDPSNINPGRLSDHALRVILDMVNLYRAAGGYPAIQYMGLSDGYQAYCALCSRADTISHDPSEIVNHSANREVSQELKDLVMAQENNHNCLAWNYGFLRDIKGWMQEGYRNSTLKGGIYDIGHRMVQLTPAYDSYVYGQAGTVSIAGLGRSGKGSDGFSYTPRIFPAGGQLPEALLESGASLMIDVRSTNLIVDNDLQVEVYLPEADGRYMMSSSKNAAAIYSVSDGTIALGRMFGNQSTYDFASVMPPWQDAKVTSKLAGKPFIFGLILRNLKTRDGKTVNMATANLFADTDKPASTDLKDTQYAADEKMVKEFKQVIVNSGKFGNTPSKKPDSTPIDPNANFGGNTGNEGGNTGNTGNEGGNSGSSGNTGNSGSSSGNKAGQSGGDAGQKGLVIDEVDEGWFRQVKTLKANPKWFWTINAGRMQAFLHKHGLDEKSFEEKYHTTVQKVLDQYADDLVSAEDLEDLMKRNFFGPYEGEDYMLSLSRALQATGYSYYAQFNLMDWSADYSNIYGLTPEADPMAEWRMNPIQYVTIQTNPDGSAAGEDGEGGDTSGESHRSNRRTRQTETSEETKETKESKDAKETQATEPAAGEESQEPTTPSAVSTQEEGSSQESQSGPTVIEEPSTTGRRRRAPASSETTTAPNENPNQTSEQPTQPAGN